MHGPKSEQSVGTSPLGKANHNFDPHYIKNIDQIFTNFLHGWVSFNQFFTAIFLA